MNKKLFKKVIPTFLIICVVLVACIILFRPSHYSNKTFDDLLGTNDTNITKVLMRNGSNGSYVETTDKQKIKEIINLVSDRNYKKASNQEARSGYDYYYDFYSVDKELLRITGSGDNVDINGKYYDVSKPISADSLAEWFNSLPIKK